MTGYDESDQPDERSKLLTSDGQVSRLGSNSDDAPFVAPMNNYGSSSNSTAGTYNVSLSGVGLAQGYSSPTAMYTNASAHILSQKQISAKYDSGTAYNEGSNLDNNSGSISTDNGSSGAGNMSSMAQFLRTRNNRDSSDGIF